MIHTLAATVVPWVVAINFVYFIPVHYVSSLCVCVRLLQVEKETLSYSSAVCATSSGLDGSTKKVRKGDAGSYATLREVFI